MVGSNLDYSKSQTLDDERPPNILRLEESEDVIESKQMKVRDLYFVNKDGFVKWTTAVTNLRPSSQSRGHSHSDFQELCIIEKGEGFLVLDGVATRVRAGTYSLIDIGVHHKMINISNTEEMVYVNHFPGHIIRENFTRKRK